MRRVDSEACICPWVFLVYAVHGGHEYRLCRHRRLRHPGRSLCGLAHCDMAVVPGNCEEGMMLGFATGKNRKLEF
jgi:hypothetical protein